MKQLLILILFCGLYSCQKKETISTPSYQFEVLQISNNQGENLSISDSEKKQLGAWLNLPLVSAQSVVSEFDYSLKALLKLSGESLTKPVEKPSASRQGRAGREAPTAEATKESIEVEIRLFARQQTMLLLSKGKLQTANLRDGFYQIPKPLLMFLRFL